MFSLLLYKVETQGAFFGAQSLRHNPPFLLARVEISGSTQVKVSQLVASL